MSQESGPQKILVVDDELGIRKTLSLSLEADGHEVVAVGTPEDALAEVGRRAFDIAFFDIRLGTASGLDLIEPALAQIPWLKIIVITAHATIDTAVEAMKLGAADYLPKPFTPGQVSMAVEKAAGLRQLERRIDALESGGGADSVDLTSDSAAMEKVYEQARQVAAADAVVLLRGENGTGKTMLARAVHLWSPRASQTFGVVSCPSLSAQLLESELFGHVRGAFTGAVKDSPGRVAKCEGGTLFLDEIGDMPMELQPKLLRFLQDREYERVGDTTTRRADVRIITATNVDLEAAVEEGKFRQDLLYRLNVVQLDIPPLRERREDVPRLAASLLQGFSKKAGKPIEGFTAEATAALAAHDWPGNVRELSNAIERATIFCADEHIGVEHLPDGFRDSESTPELGDMVSLELIEEQHIRRVLAVCPSLQQAADVLGIDQATLWRRRKKYGI